MKHNLLHYSAEVAQLCAEAVLSATVNVEPKQKCASTSRILIFEFVIILVVPGWIQDIITKYFKSPLYIDNFKGVNLGIKGKAANVSWYFSIFFLFLRIKGS